MLHTVRLYTRAAALLCVLCSFQVTTPARAQETIFLLDTSGSSHQFRTLDDSLFAFTLEFPIAISSYSVMRNYMVRHLEEVSESEWPLVSVHEWGSSISQTVLPTQRVTKAVVEDKLDGEVWFRLFSERSSTRLANSLRYLNQTHDLTCSTIIVFHDNDGISDLTDMDDVLATMPFGVEVRLFLHVQRGNNSIESNVRAVVTADNFTVHTLGRQSLHRVWEADTERRARNCKHLM